MMNRVGLRLVWNFIVLGGVLGLISCSNPEKPNIVLILADDLGWHDLGCYGSEFYETPVLDRLAREGMRFTDAYSASCVCSPTRASLLTGKSPARLHLTDWLPGRPDQPSQKLHRPNFQTFLPKEERTLAKTLREEGYATACVGKWHLGDAPDTWPEQQGFDLNIAGSGKGNPTSYFSPYALPNLPDGPQGEYLTDRMTEEALRFMEKNRKRPFFLYFPLYAVHTPLQAKPSQVEKYKVKSATASNRTKPNFLSDLGREVRQVQNDPTYAAMVKNMDENVGRLLEGLKALSLEKNTIVLFTSDNGGLSTQGGAPTSNLPLRAGKGWLYEGGVRVPLVVRWPGVTQPGSVCRQPVTSTDLFFTILRAGGLPSNSVSDRDGVDLLPALRGESLKERPLFWHYPHYSNQGGSPHGAVRLGNWKLVEWFEDMRVELYDLANDLGEKRNLATQNPEVVASLLSRLHDWRDRMGAQMPTDNPLKAKLGSPLRNGGFARKGFNLWDPSIIKVGDTYHLFASCWTSENFNAWKTSFIVRGTSKTLLGPYTFAGEVFRPRPGDFFDSEGCHNPKITFHNGKYYLYYLGIPVWKSGVAVSDLVEGPWVRQKDWCIPANNPALWIHPDGSVYGVGKVKVGNPKYPGSKKFDELLHYIHAYQAKSIFGPYTMLHQGKENALPSNYQNEDPCVWHDSQRYHMLLTDLHGLASGLHKSFVYYTSRDGISYELVSKDPLFSNQNPIRFEDGSETKFLRIERPNVVLDEQGAVIAVLAACSPENQKEGARILVFPVDRFGRRF
jgi:arylsulfatase A-like enzyme